jgi:hypothetical protein
MVLVLLIINVPIPPSLQPVLPFPLLLLLALL